MQSRSVRTKSEPNVLRSSRDVTVSATLSIEWRLEKFESLRLGVSGKVESESFHVGGYEWKLCLYPDGCDHAHKGIVGIFLRLMSEGRETRASYQMWLIRPTRDEHCDLDSESNARQLNSYTPPSQLSPAGQDSLSATAKKFDAENAVAGLDGKARPSLLPPLPPAPGDQNLLPNGPKGCPTLQKGGPRTYDNRRGRSLASWGFPTFLRRSRVVPEGYLTKGAVTVRCLMAVHSCVVPMGSHPHHRANAAASSTEPKLLTLSSYTCRPPSRGSAERAGTERESFTSPSPSKEYPSKGREAYTSPSRGLHPSGCPKPSSTAASLSSRGMPSRSQESPCLPSTPFRVSSLPQVPSPSTSPTQSLELSPSRHPKMPVIPQARGSPMQPTFPPTKSMPVLSASRPPSGKGHRNRKPPHPQGHRIAV